MAWNFYFKLESCSVPLLLGKQGARQSVDWIMDIFPSSLWYLFHPHYLWPFSPQHQPSIFSLLRMGLSISRCQCVDSIHAVFSTKQWLALSESHKRVGDWKPQNHWPPRLWMSVGGGGESVCSLELSVASKKVGRRRKYLWVWRTWGVR